MSIHKSKGLEFPIVFLCNTGKQFNMQDLKEGILLHQDIGFGPTYVNYERKIEYNTLAKEAIKVKIKNETLSEEMRLLYVALSRSKEKLIVTGITKNLKEDLKEKENIITVDKETRDKIPVAIVKNAKSYLDWLELICVYNKEDIEEFIEVSYHNKEEILNSNVEEETIQEKKDIKKLLDERVVNKKNYEMIDQKLSWEYPDISLTKIEGKSSVSKISKGKEEKIEYIDISKKPKFLAEKIELTKAEIGTVMHLVLQKLDFSLEYDEQKVRELIEDLALRDIITNNEAESVDIKKIVQFTKSELYLKIRSAKKVFKEQHFYINIPANEIYDEDSLENILVQGIIDLYAYDKDDNIILVDYKTDYVKSSEEELIEKYKKQLEIYKRAIEAATKKKVAETYIYSTYLDKEILINHEKRDIRKEE